MQDGVIPALLLDQRHLKRSRLRTRINTDPAEHILTLLFLMPYRHRRKHNQPKLAIAFIVVALGLAAVMVKLRDDEDKTPDGDVPVYGTSTDTSMIVIDDEVGVVEQPGDEALTTQPADSAVAADTPASSPAAARPTPLPTATPSAARPQPSAAQPSPTVRSRARAAIPRYQAELAKKPSDPLLLNNYAWALHEAGQYSEAEQLLRQVIRIAPNRAIAYANLGESLWKQGKNDEALAMYQRFLAMNSNPRRERIAQGKVAAIRADSGRL